MKIGGYTRQLLRNRQFIKALIHFFIDNNYFSNKGRFKVGDQVRLNWMAKYFIWSAIKDDWGKTFIVDRVWCQGENVDFINDDYGNGAAAFWLRPARKSELITVPAPGTGEQV